MRILLIDPYVAGGVSLSSSLGWLSASVRSEGHEVFVLDLNSRGIPNYQDILPNFLARYVPDMVGITVMCTTYATALQMVEHLREYFRGYIVLGGAQMSFERENALKDSERTDFVVVGEGEETLVELMDHLENSEGLKDIEGLIYRENGEVKTNSPRRPIADLNKLPFPDYRLFGLKQASPIYSYRISTSRGCPFRCVFCNPHNMQAKWRSRDFGLAIEELKFAKTQFGVGRFDICEPVFNLTSERVIEFCELLLKEKINMPWTCRSGLRADRITDEMIKLMKRAGFYNVKIGVETLAPTVFPNVKKGETIEDIVRAVEIVKRNGLRISGSFIIGLPGSTYKTDMESFKHAQKLGFVESLWFFLIPYPGTPAYHWVLEHGTMYYDYKRAHQHYIEHITKDEQLRVAFETQDYPLTDRTRMMEKILWTLKQTGIGMQNLTLWQKAWRTGYNLVRYNPWDVVGNLAYIGHGFVSQLKRQRKPEETQALEFIALDEVISR